VRDGFSDVSASLDMAGLFMIERGRRFLHSTRIGALIPYKNCRARN